tara:strand:- start:637 stop:822 length:186 start_codon:yes stop_codon:yes gene_type:complete
MDKNTVGLLVLTGVLFVIAIGMVGSLIAYDIIQEDCELLNVFRIRGEVYNCIREYMYNDYT